MTVSFYGYKPNVERKANNTPSNPPKASTTTVVTTGVLAGAGIVTGVLTKGKGGKKVVETIAKKLPELETKAKSIWGKLTGSAKKEEELRKTQEEAKKRAEEVRKNLEARRKAEQEAIERRKKEVEELQRQREIQRAEEAAKKAQAEKAALAAKKAQEANHTFKYDSKKKINSFLNPEDDINDTSFNNIKQLENEDWNTYYERLRVEKDRLTQSFNVYSFVRKIEQTSPEDAFKPIFEELEKCHQNGGTATVDDTIKILESSRSTMNSGIRFVENKDRFASYDLATEYKKYNQYLDEVIAELQANKSSGENPATIVRTSVSNVANRKKAAITARNAVLEKISQSYESQLAPIRERLHYDEAGVPPVNKHVTLNPEAKQQLADELNQIIASGGDNPNFTADSSLNSMHSAWRSKYISMPFSMQCKEGETAVLDMFPRYESRVLKLGNERYPFGGAGEFKYEPLYRQMHIENPEEFVKQFENIGGEYAPGRLQSCSKEKYYGECWGPIGNERYGFTEWEPGNNVKFVIHPKGPVSNAADIGEGKYGCCEAIYAADSRFRILGTVKKTVTPEDIQKGIPEFKTQFEDFEKYEIHLQEM